MRFLSSLLGLALPLLGPGFGAAMPGSMVELRHQLDASFSCNIIGVLEYFSGQYPVPDKCSSYYSDQVTDFCRGYLRLTTTVYTTTVTPVSTKSFVITVSTTSTSTEATNRTTTTTTTSTSTSVTATTTTTTTDNPQKPAVTGFVNLRQHVDIPALAAIAPPSGCKELGNDDFLNHPDFIISAACKCLPRRYTTVSQASTAPARTTTITTTTTSSTATTTTTTSTSISTSLTTTTTTTTSTSTSVFAIPTPDCNVEYEFRGLNPQGDASGVDPEPVTTPFECCQRCLALDNCVGAFYFVNPIQVNCQYFIKNRQEVGAPTSDLCPLGIEDYPFGDRGMGLYQGPCGY